MVEQIGKLEVSAPEQLRKLVESVTTIGAGLIIVSKLKI